MHLDKKWLRKRYIDDRLSSYEIGALVGRDPKRVWEKLKDFGIPTRARGMNLKKGCRDNYMSRPGVVNPFRGRRHTEDTKKMLSEKAKVPKPHLRGDENGMYGRCGPSNPNYVDGSSVERNQRGITPFLKRIRDRILERDGNKCRRCGSVDNIHTHHVKRWAGNPESRFDLNNIIVLCKQCHSWVHSRRNATCEFLS
jgi:hypothetical protein